MNDNPEKRKWTDELSVEDLAFLKRFALASGSLKALARGYGISYPTVRLRLDRLIQKIRILENAEQVGPFEQRLRVLLADGKIETETFRALLVEHKKEMEEHNETANRPD